MKVVIACFLVVMVLVAPGARAQTKQNTNVQQFWAAYLNQTRLTNKWGVWLDLHLRTKEDFLTNFSGFIIRPGITYYLNDATRITAGYAYVGSFPTEKLMVPEHRPWQQVQWLTNYGRSRTTQALRLEERYRRNILNDSTLADGYNFNYRLRYNFLWQVPFVNRPVKSGDFSFILNDEVHVNFGKRIVYNYFDQNRFFIGVGYHTSPQNQFQLGYLNVFQQLPAGNKYTTVHGVRLFYVHNLDLRSR